MTEIEYYKNLAKNQRKFKKKTAWLQRHCYSLTALPLSCIKRLHQHFINYEKQTPLEPSTPSSAPVTNSSYLSDYLFYAQGNEAPEMFHIWCGYGTIASAVSRRVWMTIDDSEIYPNLYVILAGRAGNGKTWSLKKAKRIIVELDLPYSASVESPSGMWRFMTGDDRDPKRIVEPYGTSPHHKLLIPWPDGITKPIHPMNIIASEFVNFISLDPEVWINALNDIFDEDDYHYRTKGGGSDRIQGPAINLIGGLTLEILSSLQKQNILNTGFGRRALIQYGERQYDKPFDDPEITPEQEAARARFVAHLRKIKEIPCQPMKMSPEAKRLWKSWYDPNLASVPSRPFALQSWYGSKSSILRKLAMLTSLAENLDCIIEPHHIEIPLAFLARLEQGLYHIFGGVGHSEMGEVALKIYNYIASQDSPQDYATIKVRVWKELPHKRGWKSELDECLDQLCGEGKLKQGGWNFGGITKIVYATPETFAKLAAAVGEFVPATEAPPESSPASLPSIDPSSEQGPTAQNPSSPGQDPSPPAAAVVAVPLPILNPKKKD